MSHLLKNMIQRHMNPHNTVLPRLQGNPGNPVRNQSDIAAEMPPPESPNNTFSGSEITSDVMAVGRKAVFDAGIQDQKGAPRGYPESTNPVSTVPQQKQTGIIADKMQEPVQQKRDVHFTEQAAPVFPKTAAARPRDMQERMQAALALKPANQNDGTPVATPLFEHVRPAFTPDFPTGFNKWQQAPDATKLPVVKIHIGRIEIKAIKESPQQQRKAPERPKPAMSLDQYLKERTKP